MPEILNGSRQPANSTRTSWKVPTAAVIIVAALALGCQSGEQGNQTSAASTDATATNAATSALVEKAGGIKPLMASDLFKEGHELFIASCTACHGPHGEAKPHLGKDIADSKFVSERTDDQLVAYVKVGRRVDDPLNTTGIDMPPKGGNPALTDEQIHKIVAYVRVLQAAARGEITLPAD